MKEPRLAHRAIDIASDHQLKSIGLKNPAYLTRGYTPDFKVVWPHEQVGDTLSHVPDNPLIEVLGLGIRLLVSSLSSSNETIQTV